MMNIEIVNEELVEQLKKLELTPTMYKTAIRSFNAIGDTLKAGSADVEVSTQGSIRFGTSIRPYRNGQDASYDIDIVAQYTGPKVLTTPMDVKKTTGAVLRGSDRYSSKLREKTRCWTIEYVEQDGIGFHVDILPCVPEHEEEKQAIVVAPGKEVYKERAISITHKHTVNYVWNPSNPGGYADWFDSINGPLKAPVLNVRRAMIFKENEDLFESAEQVPEQLVKTPLQRIIQLLKRHRDVYFSRAHNECDKPISIIITTLATQIVEQSRFGGTNTIELLKLIATSLQEYKPYLSNQTPKTSFSIPLIRLDFQKKWNIPNPVNNSENFADAWDSGKANAFFEWIDAIEADIVRNLDRPDFVEILCDKLALPKPEKAHQRPIPTVMSSKDTSKAWGL